MAFLGKLKFWKKNDDFNFGDDLGKDKMGLGNDLGLSKDSTGLGQGLDTNFGLGNEQSFPQDNSMNQQTSQQKWQQPQQSFGKQDYDPFNDSMQHGQQGYTVVKPVHNENNNYNKDKEMEIVSLKLDSLRVSIDSLNQRLANIEQMLRSRRSW